MTVNDRPEVVSVTEVKKIVTGLHDSCCAQICILFAFTKAIDLKKPIGDPLLKHNDVVID